jgi:hypothetical protein
MVSPSEGTWEKLTFEKPMEKRMKKKIYLNLEVISQFFWFTKMKTNVGSTNVINVFLRSLPSINI